MKPSARAGGNSTPRVAAPGFVAFIYRGSSSLLLQRRSRWNASTRSFAGPEPDQRGSSVEMPGPTKKSLRSSRTGSGSAFTRA